MQCRSAPAPVTTLTRLSGTGRVQTMLNGSGSATSTLFVTTPTQPRPIRPRISSSASGITGLAPTATAVATSASHTATPSILPNAAAVAPCTPVTSTVHGSTLNVGGPLPIGVTGGVAAATGVFGTGLVPACFPGFGVSPMGAVTTPTMTFGFNGNRGCAIGPTVSADNLFSSAMLNLPKTHHHHFGSPLTMTAVNLSGEANPGGVKPRAPWGSRTAGLNLKMESPQFKLPGRKPRCDEPSQFVSTAGSSAAASSGVGNGAQEENGNNASGLPSSTGVDDRAAADAETAGEATSGAAFAICRSIGGGGNLNGISRRYAKNFICNQCRECFESLSGLCEHTFAVHRAFRCTICKAEFTQRSNLQRHSLRHVGFKPFLCKVCSKAYYRKDHLVRHIELAHPNVNPRTSITVKLSSAECLDYLDRMAVEGRPYVLDPNDVDDDQVLRDEQGGLDEALLDSEGRSGQPNDSYESPGQWTAGLGPTDSTQLDDEEFDLDGEKLPSDVVIVRPEPVNS